MARWRWPAPRRRAARRAATSLRASPSVWSGRRSSHSAAADGIARGERQPPERVERLGSDVERAAFCHAAIARPRVGERALDQARRSAHSAAEADRLRVALQDRACSSRMSASSACLPLPTSTSVSLRNVGACPGRSPRLARRTSARVAPLLEQRHRAARSRAAARRRRS